MPSDCQCSRACDCSTKTITKVISSKEATKRLQRLEEEVERLKEENDSLKYKLKRASVKKEDLIKRLKKQLDNV